MSMRKKEKMLGGVQAIIMTLICILFVFPIYIAVVNAFKPTEEIIRSPLSVYFPLYLENFASVLGNKYVKLAEMYRNSLGLSLIGTFFSVLITSMASYYLARSKSKLSSALSLYFMLGMLVPYVIVYQPLCIVMRELKIPFGVPSLCFVVISCNIAFPIFMYTNFIKSLPVDLEEAAEIDGATKLQTFWKIVFPLLKPCTATILIFVLLGIWNDFQTPLLMGQVTTITVGIYTAVGPYSADWGILFAYVLFATVPVVVIFLFEQKYFVNGLMVGAVKG